MLDAAAGIRPHADDRRLFLCSVLILPFIKFRGESQELRAFGAGVN